MAAPQPQKLKHIFGQASAGKPTVPDTQAMRQLQAALKGMDVQGTIREMTDAVASGDLEKYKTFEARRMFLPPVLYWETAARHGQVHMLDHHLKQYNGFREDSLYRAAGMALDHDRAEIIDWLEKAMPVHVMEQLYSNFARQAFASGDSKKAQDMSQRLKEMPLLDENMRARSLSEILHAAASAGDVSTAEKILPLVKERLGEEKNLVMMRILTHKDKSAAVALYDLIEAQGFLFSRAEKDNLLLAALDRDALPLFGHLLQKGANPNAYDGSVIRRAVTRFDGKNFSLLQDLLLQGADAYLMIKMLRQSFPGLVETGLPPELQAARDKQRDAAWQALEFSKDMPVTPDLCIKAAEGRVLDRLMDSLPMKSITPEHMAQKNKDGFCALDILMKNGHGRDLFDTRFYRDNKALAQIMITVFQEEARDDFWAAFDRQELQRKGRPGKYRLGEKK